MEIKHIKKEDTLETEPWITARLSDPSVAGISSSRLTLSDNLDDLPSSEAQVLRNRVTALDSGKLRLLQPVSQQQLLLLLCAKQYMFWHKLVVSDVDEKLLFKEMFTEPSWNRGQQPDSRR